ncbi:MAG: GNAT family N-acetyltransferase, partial [Devosia sp.]
MSQLDLFETDRLVLSGWRRDQIEDLVRLHGDPVVARYLTPHGKPWTVPEMKAALEEWLRLFETRRMGKMRVRRKSDGVLVGRCGYGIYGPTGEPEIGYSLYPEFWGQGYAYEAASGMRDWIFRETDEPHFIGLADVRNTASLKILGKIGMTKTHVGYTPAQQLCQFFITKRPAA